MSAAQRTPFAPAEIHMLRLISDVSAGGDKATVSPLRSALQGRPFTSMTIEPRGNGCDAASVFSGRALTAHEPAWDRITVCIVVVLDARTTISNILGV